MPNIAHDATHSFDVKLEYEVSPLPGSPSWTEVGFCLTISAPKMKAKSVDVTHLRSEDKFREFMQGFRDAGEISVKLQYEKEQCEDLYEIFAEEDPADAEKTWRITFPDGTVGSFWQGAGFLQDFADGDTPEDDRLTGDVTIKLTGKPTFDPGS